jgi:hypothetical protein
MQCVGGDAWPVRDPVVLDREHRPTDSRVVLGLRAGQGDLATYAGTPLTFHKGEAVPVELDSSVVGYLDVKEIFS